MKKVAVEAPFRSDRPFFRYSEEWYHWDGQNLTKHSVLSPIFKDSDSLLACLAYREGSKMVQDQKLQFPPCDRDKVRAELRKGNFKARVGHE